MDLNILHLVVCATAERPKKDISKMKNGDICTVQSARHKVVVFYLWRFVDKRVHTWNITAGVDFGGWMLNLAPNHSDNWVARNATAEIFPAR